MCNPENAMNMQVFIMIKPTKAKVKWLNGLLPRSVIKFSVYCGLEGVIPVLK